MTSNHDRIIQALEAAVKHLTVVKTKEEYYQTLRFIGSLASHEAKKFDEGFKECELE